MTDRKQSRWSLKHLIAAVFGDKVIPSPVKLVVALGVCMALTFVLLSDDPWKIFKWVPVRPSTDLPDRIPDKVYHFTGYFTLSLVFMWYAAARARWLVVTLVSFAILHAGVTEILQGYVPDRTTDWRDFVANSLGITLGTTLGLLGRRLVLRDDPEPVLWAQRGTAIQGSDQDYDPRDPASRLAHVSAASFPARQIGLVADKGIAEPSVGFNRDHQVEGFLKNWKVRILNYRFLGITALTGAICLGGTYVLHAWQVQRNSGVLLTLGKEARAAGDLAKASDFYARYVALKPLDLNASADFGELLDDTRKGRRGIGQVFALFEQVLLADPTREDIRRRQVKVTMEMARYTDALAHLKVLRQARPDDGELDLLAGQCLEELAEFDAAAEAYQLGIDHSPELVDSYRRLAMLNHVKLDRREVATKLLDQLVSRHEKSAAAWIARARFRQEIGYLDSALEDIQVATELEPKNPEVLLAAANLAYDRVLRARADGRPAQVERIVAQTRTLLLDGLQDQPNNLDLELQLVLFESHFGDHESALKRLEAIIKANPKDTRAQTLLADLAIERGEFDRARKTLDALPRTPQADALRLFLDGRIAMAQGKWDAAIVALSEAQRYLADDPTMLERVDLALARSHEALQQVESELDAYRRLLKSNPTSLVGRLGIAACLYKVDRVPEAIAEYRQLAHMPQVRLSLARLLTIQNLRLADIDRDWRDVEMLLDDARKAQDDPIQETLLRAEMLAGKGLFEDARQLLERARSEQGSRLEYLVALARIAEHTGDQQQASLWLAQAFDAAGNSQEAELALRKAMQLGGVENPSKLAMMQFLIRQGREADAAKLFQEVGPKLSRLEVARAYALFGDLARAVALYQKELADSPERLEVLQGLADLYLKNGAGRRAEPLLRRIIAKSTQFPASALQAARRQLAVSLAGQGDYRAFQESLKLLDANSPDGAGTSEDQRARAAVLATRRNDVDRAGAIQILERLDDHDLLLQKDRWLLARLYDEAGNASQAATQFERLLKSAGDNTACLREYLDYQLNEGNLAAVEARLPRLQELAPSDAQTVRLTARWLAAKGDNAAALKTLADHAATGGSAKKTGRLILASEVAEELSQKHEADAKAWLSSSEKFLRDAVAVDPPQTQALIAWLVRQHRVSDAFAELDPLWQQGSAEVAAGVSLSVLAELPPSADRVAAIETRVVGALAKSAKSKVLKVCLADLKSLRGQVDEALNLYREVLENDSENLPALNNLAWHLALRNEHTDEALMLIERAISVAGPVGQLLDTRGCVYLAQHNLRRATQDLQAALAESPSATTHLHLAAAHCNAGEYLRARASLDQAEKLGLKNATLHPLEADVLAKVTAKLVAEKF